MMNCLKPMFAAQMMSHGASAHCAEASSRACSNYAHSIALIMDATCVASILVLALISVVSILALGISRLVVVLVVVALSAVVSFHTSRMRRYV